MRARLEKYQLEYPALSVIKSDAQLDEYMNALIELEERRDLSSDDRQYARLLAALIEKYESERYPITAVERSSPVLPAAWGEPCPWPLLRQGLT